MIIVEIGRGLGNSMFVYAAALALAKHHNTDLFVDTSYLRSWPRWEKYGGLWEFELGYFDISAKEAPKKIRRKFVFKTGFRPIDKTVKKYKLFDRNVVYFPSHGTLQDFFNIPDNTYLRGYLGRERFFKNIVDDVIKEFSLKDEHKVEIKDHLEKVKKENSVSIHVRRGDVLKLKNANVLDLGYYKKAIGIIKEKVKRPVFYVFSDDIPWCKENLPKGLGIKVNFVENTRGRGYIVIEMMRNCKNNILANSALSWWAGYLNPNKSKIVIAPENFSHFTDAKTDDDILPETWITI